MAKFEIRMSDEGTVSGKMPATAYPRGIALKIVSKDAATGINTFDVANGYADGFVTREIRVGSGLTDSELVDQLMGLPLLETPFSASSDGSVEHAQSLEVEDPDFLVTSGTGAVATNTAAGTKLSFKNGKFYIAQSGDFAQYRLVAQMTPTDGGTVRIFVEEIEGYVV